MCQTFKLWGGTAYCTVVQSSDFLSNYAFSASFSALPFILVLHLLSQRQVECVANKVIFVEQKSALKVQNVKKALTKISISTLYLMH